MFQLLSSMDKKKLIGAIRVHTELNDLSSLKYSDSTWKESVLEKIANELNPTGKIFTIFILILFLHYILKAHNIHPYHTNININIIYN